MRKYKVVSLHEGWENPGFYALGIKDDGSEEVLGKGRYVTAEDAEAVVASLSDDSSDCRMPKGY
jgi:hypothetical protein